MYYSNYFTRVPLMADRPRAHNDALLYDRRAITNNNRSERVRSTHIDITSDYTKEALKKKKKKKPLRFYKISCLRVSWPTPRNQLSRGPSRRLRSRERATHIIPTVRGVTNRYFVRVSPSASPGRRRRRRRFLLPLRNRVGTRWRMYRSTGEKITAYQNTVRNIEKSIRSREIPRKKRKFHPMRPLGGDRKRNRDERRILYSRTEFF